MAERALAASPLPRFLPRAGRRRTGAIGAAYLALTAVFVAVGFPYERLAPRVAAALEPVLGARVTIARLEPGLALLGPRLLAWDVAVVWPSGQSARLDRMRLRPAWSFSWLRGDPSFAVALRSPDGEVDGTVRIGDVQGFRGTLSGVVLERLPIAALGPGLGLTGRLDADLDLRRSEAGTEGSARLHAANGSLALPNLPVAIPFATLDGDLAFGGESLLSLESLEVEGPLVAIRGSGTVGQAPALAVAPLSLQLRLELRDPGLRQMIAGGLPTGPDGAAELSIGGTVAAPTVQPVVGRVRAGAGRAQGAP